MDKITIFQKKYYLIFSLYFLFFGIIVAILTSLVNYNYSFTDIDKRVQGVADAEIEFKRDFLFNYISKVEMLVSSIAKNDLSRQFVESGSANARKNLNDLFYALAYANKDIMQLRYIDALGKETIRVDRDKRTPGLLIFPENKLQDKSKRYYFKEASLMMAHQYWHSNIDLNMEHGKIEKPLKPTFRVATQLVFENQFKGIIIANLMFDNMIKILMNSTSFHIYLVDQDGEIISQPNQRHTWSKYLENKKTLYDIFPDKGNNILHSNILAAEGLYSYSLGDLFRNNENMKIIFVPKSAMMKKYKIKNLMSALLIALTVILVAIPLSWIVSIIPSQLQSKLAESYEKIKKSSYFIDKYVMISRTDKFGVIKEISTCFTKKTGYTPDEVIGKKHNILKHPDTRPEIHANLWKTILSGQVWQGELKDLDRNGNDIWFYKIITPEFNKKGDIEGFTAVAQDITDKKIIEQMSITDSLTGLYNRHQLEVVLSREKSRFERYKNNFSIIIIDIDFFKKVNDTYGHLAGDKVLVQLAAIFRKNSRTTDCVSRWGGEEFLIIISESDLENGFNLADKLRRKVEDYIFPSIGRITISCGVAQYEAGETTSGLISRADTALYEAKKSGRNLVVKGKIC
ncbi:MAG: diguanylate cyclase [Desulfobulbaceae bacterium]|nr:diguanylate cyclase [Desulfobulbaceae bacterium]